MQPPRPPKRIPQTPLKVFSLEPGAQLGPFYVGATGLAGGDEMRDIADEEIIALVHLIYNAYQEWKQQ